MAKKKLSKDMIKGVSGGNYGIFDKTHQMPAYDGLTFETEAYAQEVYEKLMQDHPSVEFKIVSMQNLRTELEELVDDESLVDMLVSTWTSCPAGPPTKRRKRSISE